MRIRTRRLLAVAAATIAVGGSTAFAVSANAALPATPVRLDPGLERRLHRRGQHAADSAQLDHRHRHQLPRRPGQLGHRRDPDLHQQHGNVAQDGSGNLRITPIRNGSGQWTSAADRDAAHQLQGAGRRRAAHRGPHPDAQRDRRAGGRLLARLLGARRAVPRQLPELAGRSASSTSWRTSTGSTRSGACSTVESPGRAVQRDQRPRRQPRLPGLDLPVGVPHLPLRVGPQHHARTAALVRGRPAVPHRHPDPDRRAALDQHDQPRRLLHPAQRRDGRRASRTASPARAPRPRATVSGRADAGRLRRRLHRAAVAPRRRPRRRPPTTPPPAAAGRLRQIQAESFNAQSGVHDGGVHRGRPEHRLDRATATGCSYNNVNFGTGAGRATSWPGWPRAPAAASSGLIEVRLDSRSNAPIGSFALGNTGGWQTWRSIPGNVVERVRHAHGLPDLHQRPARPTSSTSTGSNSAGKHFYQYVWERAGGVTSAAGPFVLTES